MSATLLAHKGSRHVTMDALRALPAPVPMGPRHFPVKHSTLVETLQDALSARGYEIQREQFAINQDAGRLFGVLDLSQEVACGDTARVVSLGFRTSIEQSLAVQIVAGSRVMVCDNLVMAGDMIALKRKSTRYFDLRVSMLRAVDVFTERQFALTYHIERLRNTPVSDGYAKQVAFDMFAKGVLPVRLLDDVNRYYFEPAGDATDCHERTLWGLQNAFTRAARELAPARQLPTAQAIGAAFGLVTNEVR